MKTTIEKMDTTTVTKSACGMRPDPCNGHDTIVAGVGVHGGEFSVRVHHRGRQMWVAEVGDLRQDWRRFHSLNEAIEWLETTH